MTHQVNFFYQISAGEFSSIPFPRQIDGSTGLCRQRSVVNHGCRGSFSVARATGFLLTFHKLQQSSCTSKSGFKDLSRRITRVLQIAKITPYSFYPWKTYQQDWIHFNDLMGNLVITPAFDLATNPSTTKNFCCERKWSKKDCISSFSIFIFFPASYPALICA